MLDAPPLSTVAVAIDSKYPRDVSWSQSLDDFEPVVRLEPLNLRIATRTSFTEKSGGN